MIARVAVFVLLVVCCTIEVKAQCIPDPVYTVELENTTLVWDPSTNCATTHYIVNIHSGGVLEYVYQVDGPALNVTFLSYCKSYTFTVTAIADHIIGQETQYEATIGLPAGVNITVSNFTGDQIDRDVLLQWHINTDYLYCAESYKILLWREDSAAPEEIQTYQNAYYLLDVSQCMTFELEISVEHLTFEHPVAKFNYTVPAATNTPRLAAIRQDTTTINTTWALDSYAINQCNVTALYVKGPRFTATINVHDVPARPTIDVSIPGLRADSMYFFNVTVENEAGISPAYQLAVQTLPIDPSVKSDLYEDNYYSYIEPSSEDVDSYDSY